MNQRATRDCAELRRLYEGEGLSVAEVARRMGCSAPTISNWLRRCGVATRPSRFAAKAVPGDELRQLYVVEGRPVRQIAAQLGVSLGTVNNWRRRLGIPPRRPRGGARG